MKNKKKKLFKKKPKPDVLDQLDGLDAKDDAMDPNLLDDAQDDIDLSMEDSFEEDELIDEEVEKASTPKVMTKKKKKLKKKQNNLSMKPRKGLGEDLIEVYETAGDDLSSITTLEHRRRSWQRMLIWILLFLVAVFIGVAAVSWYIWGGTESFTGDNVEFTVEAPEESSSGKLVSYSVSYINNESTSFRKSEIELRYPPGFIFEKADPEPSTGENLWDLGSLAAGHSGVITLDGYLVGRPDVDTTLSAVFRYWPANFSSEFQEVASGQTKISATEVELRLDGPDQVLVGQNTSYSVVLGNSTDFDYKNLQVELIFPDEFVIDEVKPELKDDKNLWDFDEIKAGEEIEILVDGYFSAAPEDEVELIANLNQKGASDDDFFQQKEERLASNIIEGDLIVNLIANGSTKDTTVQWGENINVSINFQNNSEADLSELKAVARFESRYRTQKGDTASDGVLNWGGLVDSNKGSLKDLDNVDDNTLRNRTITWTGEDLDELQKLSAETEGTINFQIPVVMLNEVRDLVAHPDDVEINLVVDMIIGKTGQVEEEVTVSSNEIKFMVDTNLGLDAHSRYFDADGNELGSGPLPPEIGEKTTYKIFWDVFNSLHEVNDLIVSAELPSNVNWTNKFNVTAGEVEFRSADNTITWRLNKLPLDVTEMKLSFDVELNPAERQIGEVANLTKKITMTATDAVTGGKIIHSISPLNTGVDQDSLASDKGLVIQ